MNSIVERLRDNPTGLDMHDAADLIEQQAERIKELEALAQSRLEQMNADRKAYLDLRQKIEDAPVVAEVERERGLTYGNRGAAPVGTKLISKGDLK